jgi:prevent-host-death family protein
VNTHEAKSQLSRVLRRAATGEKIIIANREVSVARLISLSPKKAQRAQRIFRG